MKSIFILALLCFSSLSAFANTQQTSKEQAQIKEVFAQYMRSYNNYLKTNVMLKDQAIYTETLMLITPNRAPAILDETKFSNLIEGFLDGLRSKGVNNIAWEKLQIKLLSNSVAVASNAAVRYKKNGDVYDHAAATYMLTKVNEQWKIATLAPHAAENILPFS